MRQAPGNSYRAKALVQSIGAARHGFVFVVS